MVTPGTRAAIYKVPGISAGQQASPTHRPVRCRASCTSMNSAFASARADADAASADPARSGRADAQSHPVTPFAKPERGRDHRRRWRLDVEAIRVAQVGQS